MFLAKNFRYVKSRSRANKLFTLLKRWFLSPVRFCSNVWIELVTVASVVGVANGVIKWNLQFLSVCSDSSMFATEIL